MQLESKKKDNHQVHHFSISKNGHKLNNIKHINSNANFLTKKQAIEYYCRHLTGHHLGMVFPYSSALNKK